ncbi:hypothetical protein [Eubacterium sp.]|uniref:hypothetical protein n=1 Tax=Eubacterium sp. TaxID=142586 RepID=UPI0035217467
MQEDTMKDNVTEENIWKAEKEVVVEEKKSFANKPQKTSGGILTINPNDNVTFIDPEKALWHELNTAFRKKTILKSTVDEISKTPNGVGIVVTYYKNQRITIPLAQMGLNLSDDAKYQESKDTRLFKLATTYIGAEIDFIVKSVDEKNKVVLASRKEALISKIRTYYATLDNNKVSMIGNNPDVQARVVSVGRKNLGVEVFGIQTQINAKDVFYEWIVDLRNTFSPGDVILVNVEEIQYPEYFEGCEDNDAWLLGIKIKASHKKFEKDYPSMNFENHTVGSKTRGTITEITENGTIHIILKNKVNAIAHMVAGNRTPLVGDTVSYVCTRKDEKTHVSIGQITKILSSEY